MTLTEEKKQNIKSIVGLEPSMVKNLKQEYLTMDFVIELIKANVMVYDYIENKYSDNKENMEELNQKALEINNNVFKRFKSKYRTEELSKYVIKKNGDLLPYLSNDLIIDYPILEDAINATPTAIGLIHDYEEEGTIYYNISVQELQKLIEKAINIQPEAILFVYSEYISKENQEKYKNIIEQNETKIKNKTTNKINK